MKTITSTELTHQTKKVVNYVKSNQREVVITSYDIPIAKIVPLNQEETPQTRPSVDELLEYIETFDELDLNDKKLQKYVVEIDGEKKIDSTRMIRDMRDEE